MLHAERTGAWLASSIEAVGLPQIDHVRGRGLLRGVVLTEPISADIARRALERGFIVNAPRPDVLRLAPPLIVTTDDLQPFIDALPDLVA